MSVCDVYNIKGGVGTVAVGKVLTGSLVPGKEVMCAISKKALTVGSIG
jgi:translation elongation factor EF-1alpha